MRTLDVVVASCVDSFTEWNVPRKDARWMGQLLARLSPAQIADAFRAAGYSPQEVQGFSEVLQKRIEVLTDL